MAGVVAPDLPEARSDAQAIATHTSEGRPRSAADVLVDLGRWSHALFHDPGGDPFAKVDGGAYAVNGGDYKDILNREFYRLAGRGANRNALADAVGTLSAVARYDGPEEPVYLRVGEHVGGIVIDGGGASWSGYHVTAERWDAVDALPINFRRSGKMTRLPIPTAPDFSKLWRYVNVVPEHRVLVAAWLLAALRPTGPYPLLVLAAEQGAGKSSTARALKALTDPSASPLRSPPRDDRDLLVAATSSRVLALDNLSGLDPQMSDALCRLSTGGALSGRKLYSDNDEILIEVQRPVILNGIDDLASRPDLAQRCIHVSMPPLVDVGAEADMAREFSQDAGAIFAALLEALSLALRDVTLMTHVTLGRLPRMADFACWAAAGIPALGFTPDEFMNAYRQNQAEAIATGLESSPVGQAIIDLMAPRDTWRGSGGDLLRALSAGAGDGVDSKYWPRSPKGLVNALRRLAPSLRHVGIDWRHERTADTRTLVLCKVPGQVSQVSCVTRANDGMTLMTHSRPPCTAKAVVCKKCDGEGCRICEPRVTP